jgi:two-component system sensor histidine kinase RegB
VISQVVLFLSVYLLFNLNVPLVLVTIILAFQSSTNLFFNWFKKKNEINEHLFVMVLVMDVILLTVLIYNTGGAMNPFTFLYLVHVVLGAVLTRPKWSWALMLFTLFCYGSLFLPISSWIGQARLLLPQFLSNDSVVYSCDNSVDLHRKDTEMNLHLQGMWVAFAITSFFIVFMVGQIQKTLLRHQRIEDKLREEKVKNERLASLTTLAAGAAHEFSTPLATIAVASKEMVYALEKCGEKELVVDALLIRNQVEKCREILFEMSADAGEYMGEAAVNIELKEFISGIVAECRNSQVLRLEIEVADYDLVVCMPVNTLKRTVKELISNSCDAAVDDSSVIIHCSADKKFVYLEVRDTGEGMAPETVAKAFDPFFTTKETGKGFGLGLYLAKTMAERFGGDLVVLSELGKGTRAVLKLPKSKGPAGNSDKMNRETYRTC